VGERAVLGQAAQLAGDLPLRAVEGTDHPFRVLERSGRSDAGVSEELVDSFERRSTALV
jgi:hypothetical protein